MYYILNKCYLLLLFYFPVTVTSISGLTFQYSTKYTFLQYQSEQ